MRKKNMATIGFTKELYFTTSTIIERIENTYTLCSRIANPTEQKISPLKLAKPILSLLTTHPPLTSQ